jgi:hypothetical protein
MSQPPPPLYPSPEDEPVPQLTPEVVADDEDLGVLVDELVRRDPEARAGLRDIALRQDALRQGDPEGWPLFLMVEEMMTARFADVVLVVARWAFMAGQRYPLPKTQTSNVNPDEQTSGPQQGGA